ncbi:hypothetical protein [Bradyrhizobium jicamae]|uniref:hypothetical protein n=1 Tax=Bradyrhizobium jicamae TaxID=280332 RepID=UPI001BA69F7B|nr:hypothetical protein [Bradyrhizobium jicamae]MBR0937418.1 hypothetical protein [Bradyrhizobium jicamae]
MRYHWAGSPSAMASQRCTRAVARVNQAAFTAQFHLTGVKTRHRRWRIVESAAAYFTDMVRSINITDK